jgi:uncharacterized zinc-type alcohol dehydrogenase-like protein
MNVSAYAANGPHEKLAPFSYEMGELGAEQVDIRVINCRICHSDLSMMNNDWGMTAYPIVPGHEIIGEVVAAGNAVKNAKVGDKVGLGWFSGSCMSCHECMDGSHHYDMTFIRLQKNIQCLKSTKPWNTWNLEKPVSESS